MCTVNIKKLNFSVYMERRTAAQSHTISSPAEPSAQVRLDDDTSAVMQFVLCFDVDLYLFVLLFFFP